MKKLIVSSLLALFFFGFLFINIKQADAYVNVSGYYKKNGTYVAPYVRSNPNGLKYDNYGYKPSQGLYNPSYGTRGTAWDTPTYITDPSYYEGKSLYDSGSYGYSSPSTYTTTPSCPSMSSYNSATDNCQCYSGYVVSGSSCVNAMLYCSDKIGIMSQYNSISKMCECMSGYEYDGLSCVYKKTSSSLYGASAYDAYATSNYNCPLNSHTSPTESSKCLCDTGYGISATKDSCILLPVKTPDQLCKDSFGLNSIEANTKNDKGETQCICNVGYEWALDRKSCIKSVVVANTPPLCTISFYPKTVILGKTVTMELKTTGVVNKASSLGTGFMAFTNTYSIDTNSYLFNLLNSGKSFTSQIKPDKIGKSSTTYTVTGPGGTSSCTGSFTITSKPSIAKKPIL